MEPSIKSKIESGAQSVKVAKKKTAVPKEVKEEPKARTFEEIAEERMKKTYIEEESKSVPASVRHSEATLLNPNDTP